MHGTAMVKAARLGANLVAHPNYIKPYLTNYISPKAPVDLELPWFAYSVIQFLDETVRSKMLVYEYGSGGSTLYFARRCARVVSIEDDLDWHDRVSRIIHDRRIANVDLRFCATDLTSVEAFRASSYADCLPEEPADIIVVDGSELTVQVRPLCFEIAETRVKSGGMIIVDDSWRYTDLRRRNRAKKVRVFKSVGPARPGVTSTDVFFY